ncbi:transglutaminase domain-containing protein [Caproiciproducens sp. R1]|uniref:transglutaminase domain-containing protein n=1 Tax=Caproiciproducens sp. R1 TaxID=3435000 RepID=UPI0040334A65
MIFSQELQDSVHRQFLKTQSTLGLRGGEILSRLDGCEGGRRTAMEFFYSTMPSADLGDYDFSLYLSYVDFGLFLREHSPWGGRIPENIFLNYVLYYRINNEKIEECRKFFYDALNERIRGMSMKEAALEVNVWCAEHVTYQATDERTVSPLTALRSSYGRCGEESTFAVTALRSVGIPARQVYTPRWAHCDDNHAWVEVWCDGEWYFLGACEPEPVLNRGWFTEAAARSMLMDSKSFLPIEGEEPICTDGQTIILNEIRRYADARRFTVTVTDGSGPVSGVTVGFELLNGAEFFPVAAVVTDETGRAGVTLGFGSVHIHAEKDGSFVEAFADTEETDGITVDFSGAVRAEPDAREDFCFRAPKDSTRNLVLLSPEQKERRKQIVDGAERKRQQYAKSFYQKEKAEKLAAAFARPQEVLAVLKAAEGNFEELYRFLSMDFGRGNRELQLKMLQSLPKKDWRDVGAALLAEHFTHSLRYQADYPEEIFVPYILCPRAHFEQLTPYSRLLSGLLDEQAAAFRRQPGLVWEYVSRFEGPSERDSERLPGTPAGILSSGQANEMGRGVLFTAVCRTLGIPARINSINLYPQYYQNGGFKNAQEASGESCGKAVLTLLGGEENWSYLHNWTIAVLKDGVYRTLELSDSVWTDTTLTLSLLPGHYRLITSSRTPNGNQFAKKYCFRLADKESKELSVSLFQTQISDLFVDIPLPPFQLTGDGDEPVLSAAVTDGKTAVLIWLEEGREPTEHILNELIGAREKLNALGCELVFILRGRSAWENETFAKAYRAIPGARVYYSDFAETAAPLARRTFVDPEKLPLTIVARDGRGIYACSGYNVGVADLLIKIIAAAGEKR